MIKVKDLELALLPSKTIVVVLENPTEHPLKVENYRAQIQKILSPVKVDAFNFNCVKLSNGSTIYFIPYRSKAFRGIHADLIIHIDSHLYKDIDAFLHREVYPMMKHGCLVKYWSF